MNTKKDNPRRGFIKKSMLAASGLPIIPGFVLKQESTFTSILEEISQTMPGQNKIKTVAFIANIYRNSAHADVIGTKLFAGIPTDDGMVAPQVKIVSMWIDQIGENDTGVQIAKMNGVPIYPTIDEALTLGGDKLAVDAVIYIGEHGTYPKSRLGVKMYPRMNYPDLELSSAKSVNIDSRQQLHTSEQTSE